jgi:hypothetical protein
VDHLTIDIAELFGEKNIPHLVGIINKYPLQRDIFCIEASLYFVHCVWSKAPKGWLNEAKLLGWKRMAFWLVF